MRRKIIRLALTAVGLFLLVLSYEHCTWSVYYPRWRSKYMPIEQKQPQEPPPPLEQVSV